MPSFYAERPRHASNIVPFEKAGRASRVSSHPIHSVGGLIEPEVAAAFGVPLAALRAPTRGRAPVALARQCAMYLAHTLLGLSFTAVGAVCGRDRGTVAHGCRVVEDRRDDAAFDAKLCALETRLAARLAARPTTAAAR